MDKVGNLPRILTEAATTTTTTTTVPSKTG